MKIKRGGVYLAVWAAALSLALLTGCADKTPTMPAEAAQADNSPLDLTGQALTEEEYLLQKQKNPDRVIIWDVPVGDARFRSDSTALALPDADEETLAMLGYFDALESVDATGSTCYAALLEAEKAFDGVAFTWTDTSGAVSVQHGGSAIDLADAVGVTKEDLAAVLLREPQVRLVCLAGSDLDMADAAETLAAYPEVTFDFIADLYGVPVDSAMTELVLSDIPITDLQPLYRLLPLLKRLTHLEMCGCGVPDEQMAALQSAFDGIKIVWTVDLGYWTVRTDITYFATWRIVSRNEDGLITEAYSVKYDGPGCTDEELYPLKYCTDLVALDVGHNDLTNLDFLYTMPKLEYLIIAGNEIRDITPIAGLKNLKYLEFFANRITDVTPLAELENLLDLNMCCSPVADLSPLYGLKQLERMFVTPYGFADVKKAVAEFSQQVPDCEVVIVRDDDLTGYGWRAHDRYFEMRAALGRYIPPRG